MHLSIGHVRYEVVSTRGLVILDDGRSTLATCDLVRCRITLSEVPPPSKRWQVLWHEIGHAIKEELDPHHNPMMTEETLCDLLALGVSGIGERDVARLRLWVFWGIDAEDVMLLPSIDQPIPVLRYR